MDAVKVAVRVRPLIPRETGSPLLWSVDTKQIKSKENSAKSYNFDRVFDLDETSEDVYEEIAEPIIETVMEGFNGTIFAYGQTSSGKTYSMMGETSNPGIIPRSVNEVFNYIQKTPNREFLLRVSYMEIYNEVVRDLLTEQNENLQIREDEFRNSMVVGLSEHTVMSAKDVMKLMSVGEQKRRVGCTNMNERSSRSHTIFRMIIESRERQAKDVDSSEDGAVMVSQLNMVDLAGSERASQTGAEGQRFKEGCHINKSLFVLGQVINQISKNSESMSATTGSGSTATKHVNYRNSKLTRILQPALGGNSLTAIICAVTPAAMDETESTLRFASSAKRLKNKPKVNEVLTDEAQLTRQRKEIRELKKLVEELQQKSASSAIDEELESLKRQRETQIQRLQKLILVSNQDSNDQPKKRKLRRETWCGQKLNAASGSIAIEVPFLDSNMSNTTLLDDSTASFLNKNKRSLNLEYESKTTTKKKCNSFSRLEIALDEDRKIVEEREKKELRTRVKELEEQVKMMTDACSNLEQELKDSKAEAAADKELVHAKTQTILQLEECVEMLKENWDEESKAEDENEKLQLEIHKLKRELVTMQNRTISSGDAPARTSAFMEDMTAQLRESLTEKRKLQDNYDELFQQHQELTLKLDEAVLQKNSLEHEVGKLHEEIDGLRSDVEKLNNASQKSPEGHATMNNTSVAPGERTIAMNDAIEFSEQLIKDREDSEKIIASLNEEIEGLKTRNKQLMADLDNVKEQDEFNKLERQSIHEFAHEQKEENNRLSQALKCKEEELEQIKNPSRNVSSNVNEAQESGDVDELKEANEDLRRQVEDSLNEMIQLKTKLTNVVDQNTEYKELNTKQQQEIANLMLSAEQMHVKLQEYETSMMQEDGALKSPKEVVEQMLHLKSDAGDAQHLLQESNCELSLAKTKVHELEQQLQEQERELKLVKCDLESVTSMQDINRDKHDRRMKELTQQLQEAYAQQTTGSNHDSSNEVASLQSKISEKVEEISSMKQQMNQLHSSVESLKTNIDSSEEKTAFLQTELDGKDDEIAQLKEQLNQANSCSNTTESTESAAEKLKLSELTSSLQSEIASKDAEINVLKEQLKEVQTKTNHDNVNELANKQQEIAQLESKIVEFGTIETELNSKLELLQTAHDQMKNENKSLQEVNEGLRTNVMSLEEKVTSMSASTDGELREALRVARMKMLTLQSQHEKLLNETHVTQGALLAETNLDLHQKRLLSIADQQRRDSHQSFAFERSSANKEIEALKKKVDELKTQLCKANCDRDVSMRQKNTLEEECNILKEQIKEYENIHNEQQSCVIPRQLAMDPDKLMTKIKQLNLNLELTKQTSSKSMQENKRLKEQNKQLEAECFQAMNLRAKMSEMEHKLERGEEEQEQQKNTMKKKTEESVELRTKINQLIQEKSKLQSALDKLTQEHQMLVENESEYKRKMEGEKSAMVDQLNHLQEKIQTFKLDLKEKDSHCNEIINKLEETESSLQVSSCECHELKQKIDMYQAQLKNVSSEEQQIESKLQKELENTKTALLEAEKNYTESLEVTSKLKLELQNNRQQYEQELGQSKEQCNELNEKLLALQEESSRVTNESQDYSELQKKLKSAQEEVTSNKTHCEEMSAKFADCEAKLADATSSNEKYRADIENLRKELDSTLAKLEERNEIKEKVATLEDQLDASRDEIGCLKSSLGYVEEDKQHLSEELEHEKSSHEELNEKMRKISCRKERSQNIKMSLLEQELQQMSEKHAALKVEYDEIKAALDELKEKNNELQTTQSFIDHYEQKLCVLKDEETSPAPKEENVIQQSSNDSESVIKNHEIETLKNSQEKIDDGIGFASDLDQELIESLQLKVTNMTKELSDKEDEVNSLKEDLMKLQNDVPMKREEELNDTEKEREEDQQGSVERISKLETLLEENASIGEELRNKQMQKEEEYEASIAEYENKLSNAHTNASEHEEKIKALEAEVGELKKEIDDLQQRTTLSVDENMKEYKDELCDKENQLLMLRNEKQEVEDKLTAVTLNIVQYEKALPELRMQLTTLQEKINSDAKKMQSLSDNCENANAHITKLQSRKQELDNELEHAQSGVQELQVKLDEATEKISQLEKSDNDVQSSTTKISKDLTKAQIELEFLKNQNEDFEKILSDKKQTLEKLQIDYDKVKQEFADLKNAMGVKENQCKELEAHLVKSDNICSDLKMDVELKVNEITELQKDVEFHKNESETTKVRLNEIFEMIKDKASEMEEVAQNREALDIKVDGLNAEVKELTAKLSNAEEENNNLLNENKKYKSDVKTLEERLGDVLSVQNDTEDVKQNYEDKIKVEKDHNHELAASYDALVKDLESAVKEKEEAMELSESSVANLNKEKKFFENEIEGLNIKYMDFKNKCEKMNRMIRDKDEEIVALKNRAEAVEEEFETNASSNELSEEIERKNRQINALKNEIKNIREAVEMDSNTQQQNLQLVKKYSTEVNSMKEAEEKLKMELEKKRDELSVSEKNLEDAIEDVKKKEDECKQYQKQVDINNQKLLEKENEMCQLKNEYTQQYNNLKVKFDEASQQASAIGQENEDFKRKYEESQHLQSSHTQIRESYNTKLQEHEQMLNMKDQNIKSLNEKLQELMKIKKESVAKFEPEKQISQNNVDATMLKDLVAKNKSLKNDIDALRQVEALPTAFNRAERTFELHRQTFVDALARYDECKFTVLGRHKSLYTIIGKNKDLIKNLQNTNNHSHLKVAENLSKACELQKIVNNLVFQQVQEAEHYNGYHREKFKTLCHDFYNEYEQLLSRFENKYNSLKESLSQTKVPDSIRTFQFDNVLADEIRKFTLFYIKYDREVEEYTEGVKERMFALENIQHQTDVALEHFDNMKVSNLPKNESAAKCFIIEKQRLGDQLLKQQETDIKTKVVKHEAPRKGVPRMQYLEMFKDKEKFFETIKQDWMNLKTEISHLQFSSSGNNALANELKMQNNSLRQQLQMLQMSQGGSSKQAEEINHLRVAKKQLEDEFEKFRTSAEESRHKLMEELKKQQNTINHLNQNLQTDDKENVFSNDDNGTEMKKLQSKLHQYQKKVDELKAGLSETEDMNFRLKQQIRLQSSEGEDDTVCKLKAKTGSRNKGAVGELMSLNMIEQQKRETTQKTMFLEKELAKYKDIETKRRDENTTLLEENKRLRDYIKKGKSSSTNVPSTEVMHENSNNAQRLVSPAEEPDKCSSQ